MKKSLLQYLCCPGCRGELTCKEPTEVVLDGQLQCELCRAEYPVVRGVPQLLSESTESISFSVAEAFAAQWQEYSEKRSMYRKQYLDWLRPVDSSFFQGKLILDVGCGKGRHLLESATFGAELVVGVDLGFGSTQVAEQATKDLGNVQVVRADIYNLPFRNGLFDYAHAIGVLHHLPDPRKGFESVVRAIKPEGHISAWVYGQENNEWIVKYVNPFRVHVSGRLPESVLRYLARFLAAILKFAGLAIYKPLGSLLPSFPLFYRDYIDYISAFPFREIESIVFDHLHPEIAFYLSREEFSAWFEGFEHTQIAWHNRNSWRGFGQVPSREA